MTGDQSGDETVQCEYCRSEEGIMWSDQGVPQCIDCAPPGVLV